MSTTNDDSASSKDRPAITLKISGLTLTGPAAVVGLLVLLSPVVALVVLSKPQVSWSPLWVSAGLWIAFILYWSSAAKNAARSSASESRSSRQVHQLLMYGALVLAFLRVPGLRERWLPASTVLVAAGLALQIASALLAVWARRHLGRNWSGAIDAKEDHRLIATGPYARVRHPIYTGMLGMLTGTAMVSGELHALVAVALLAIAYWRKIRSEERNLHGIFGHEYEEYRGRSWALIPGIV